MNSTFLQVSLMPGNLLLAYVALVEVNEEMHRYLVGRKSMLIVFSQNWIFFLLPNENS